MNSLQNIFRRLFVCGTGLFVYLIAVISVPLHVQSRHNSVNCLEHKSSQRRDKICFNQSAQGIYKGMSCTESFPECGPVCN